MALTLGPALAAEETIDFESDPAGSVLSSVGSVTVLGTNPNFAPGTNAAVIFDTANPTGGDDDLGSPNSQCPGGGPGNGLGGERARPTRTAPRSATP